MANISTRYSLSNGSGGKKCLNKNFYPKDGCARLVNLTHEYNYTRSFVIFLLDRVIKIFRDCLILMENCEIFVFTSISENLLCRIQSVSQNTNLRPFSEFYKLLGQYGDNNSYLIGWNNENECYVLPKCADTINLFKRLMNEKKILLPTAVSASLESLFATTDVRHVWERKQSNSVLERKSIVGATERNRGNSVQEINSCSSVSNSDMCKPHQSSLIVNNSRHVTYENKHSSSENNSYRYEVRRKTISLTRAQKYFPPRYSTTCVFPLDGGYPEMISADQAGNFAYSFANGVSISLPSNQRMQTRLPADLMFEQTSRPPKYSQYVDNSQRLRSFDRWPLRSPTTEQLCEAGFFWTGNEDLVRCYQCGIGLKDFSVGDDPLLEHVRYSGDCAYLLDYLGPTRLAQLQGTLHSQYDEENQSLWLRNNSESTLTYTNTCRHPEYSSFEARMTTFTRWPPSLMQRPEQLAEAGLYYTGVEDHVRCFSCDGGLRRWDPEDDPWTEHCRWFPTCPYARQVKGDEYIALVQSATEPEDYEAATAGETDLTRTMAQMTLRDPQYQWLIDEHKQSCTEMGYKEEDFNETVQELQKRGNLRPTLEDIVDTIMIVVDNREAAKGIQAQQNETPEEENKRLKRNIICMICQKNTVNALFLPCTHHRLCMDCADPISKCPVCDRNIREKIKTYMA